MQTEMRGSKDNKLEAEEEGDVDAEGAKANNPYRANAKAEVREKRTTQY